jgi:DNA-binding response OmpR family regulator
VAPDPSRDHRHSSYGPQHRCQAQPENTYLLQAGAQSFLTKPIDVNELLDLVNAITAQRTHPVAAPTSNLATEHHSPPIQQPFHRQPHLSALP